ncbi:helix-turn-helix transcriptional regulator [Brevibacillus marinus]|uniref:helix-turn-helix transcriptional regulator n=1 Tax=Brevibacillus marinus TaxID=2496837 RepID=UPI000F8481A8|nr:helix-turn-helix transcriptional regulator [Brevibacillus marinus]
MRDYQWLEALRLQQGLTQAEVARRAKIDRTYYTKIERGKTPSVRVAMRIADALGFRWTLFYESHCALSAQKTALRSRAGTDERKTGRA